MSTPIKQFVVVRRRAGQTIKAFHDYHFQQHGSISQGPDPEENPSVYYQTHFFDSVYSNAKLAQPWYAGHNDSTELYFDSPGHMKQVFSSAHVREKVGPDGVNFNDFAATIAMFAHEEVTFEQNAKRSPEAEVQAVTATYWLQTIPEDARAVQTMLTDLIKSTFEGVAMRIVSNTVLPDPGGMLKYFQGEEAPQYSAAYQIYISDAKSVEEFERLRLKLETIDQFKEIVRPETTFVVFGVRSLVFDQTKNIAFDPSRQPKLP